MSQPFSVRCRACHHQTPYTQPYTACPQCGQSWLDAVYDLNTVAQQWPANLANYGASLWRYRDLLPIRNPANIVSLGEGWTPLIQAHNLGLLLGHDHIFIKDERQGPTASFKDRQAAIAISVMKEAGVKEAVVASTGNVAIAYAAFCARAGIKLWTFVTSSVPAEKMREVALYGAEVIKVAGTYDQCKQVATEFAQSKGIYLDKGIRAISAKEAMKTLAFEVAEQLGAIRGGSDYTMPNPGHFPWQAPDWYLQSVSGGLGPVGVIKGFRELKAMGLIDKVPKLAIFQVAGCAPMVNAFHKGSPVALDVENPITDIATLATGRPGEAYQVLRDIIREHGGTMEIVTDAEAFRALHVLAKMDGFSVEPATGVTFAGLFNLIHQGIIGRDETVVVNCSGHTFPVEKHIVGEHHTRDMVLAGSAAARGREEGLVTALEELDDRVQRIAIIEDNPDATRLIRRILQAQGEFLIEEATNGLDGLDLIRRTRPNLVILDLMMPGIDGFGVVEAMKEDTSLQDIPIIVITAKTLTPNEKRWLDSQVDGLWEKGSFMDVDLLSHIRQKLP